METEFRRRRIIIRIKAVILISLSLLISSCATLSFESITSLQNRLGIKSLPVASDYPGADGVIILDRTNVVTEVDTNYNYHTTVTVHRVERVFSNFEKEAPVTIRLRPGRTLLAIRARTIEPNGKTLYVRARDFLTTYGNRGAGSVFPADAAQLKFVFRRVTSGAILEYAYAYKESVPFPAGEWVIQRHLPVMRSIYSLTVPSFIIGGTEKDAKDWQWNYVTYNYPDIGEPTVKRHYKSEGSGGNWHNLASWTLSGDLDSEGEGEKYDRNLDEFTWTLKDVPAFHSEPNMPPKDWYRGYVQFAPSFWQSWNDVSKWYYDDFIKPRLIISDAVRKKAEMLVNGASSEIDSLGRILKYVQGIRYVESKRLLGDLAPEYPQKVMESGKGDCRGKSLLLTALLKAVGIYAKPAVVVARSNSHLDTHFPCWRFHRMLVGALIPGNRIVWFDAAARFCGVGEVPPEDEAAVALVMNDDGTSFFIVTPGSHAWNNPIDITVKVTEYVTTPSVFHATIAYGGEAGIVMRNKLAKSDSQTIASYSKSLLSGAFRSPDLISCRTTSPDSLHSPFTLAFEFSATNAVPNDSTLYSLYVEPFPAFENLGWLTTGLREYPVEFEYPYVLTERVDVLFEGDSMLVKHLPGEVDITNPDFEYSSSYASETPGMIKFSEVLASKSRLLDPDRFDQAVSFLDTVSTAKGEPVLLERKR